MGLYKKSNLKDERITNIKNKIYSEIHILVMVILSISVVLKYFFYNLGAESIATELFIFFASGVYSIYRSTKLGVFSAEIEMHDRKSKWSKQKKDLFLSITLGIVIALGFGINSAVRYADGTSQSISYFLLTTFASLLIYLPFFLIFVVGGNEVLKKNSEKSINKMLDDEPGDYDEKY
ncbi:hypothetical protein A1A1_16680 [Planococcus antarcticus DSM 14505]|uniref:Uncharacterized protein n=1 Tax=Planococcus antarcticus DSM 14505 TaxID=1185653 RepID=A0AA87IID3_9BACL|nr:DUF6773 family protein [Planococcus antarcticus]EIM05376.1 hypothetical protein A1A1_16680 [Planococcus antarcticus DSM 14505]